MINVHVQYTHGWLLLGSHNSQCTLKVISHKTLGGSNMMMSSVSFLHHCGIPPPQTQVHLLAVPLLVTLQRSKSYHPQQVRHLVSQLSGLLDPQSTQACYCGYFLLAKEDNCAGNKHWIGGRGCVCFPNPFLSVGFFHGSPSMVSSPISSLSFCMTRFTDK